jgi:hypothetical protein
MAYELFDQGFGPSDPEVKAMVPKLGPPLKLLFPVEKRQRA